MRRMACWYWRYNVLPLTSFIWKSMKNRIFKVMHARYAVRPVADTGYQLIVSGIGA